MKKYGLIAAITLMAVLTACGKPNTATDSETGDDTIETVVETGKDSDTTAPKREISDYESQISLLAKEYSKWNDDICAWQFSTNDEVVVTEAYKVAVTDLNRNGRLELICSSMQGTGLFSLNFMYEVDESKTGLNKLAATSRDDGVDKGGDFIRNSLLNCYKKDGKYYYAVDDYTPSGASVIEDCLYSYSFEDGINNELIGGYTLKVDEYDYDIMLPASIYVKFYDEKKDYVKSSKALYEHIDDYWKDYEKQSCVKIKWVDYPLEDECAESMKRSYEGYNEESEHVCDSLHYYKSFYGDSPEYMIRQVGSDETIKDDEATEKQAADANSVKQPFSDSSAGQVLKLMNDCNGKDLDAAVKLCEEFFGTELENTSTLTMTTTDIASGERVSTYYTVYYTKLYKDDLRFNSINFASNMDDGKVCRVELGFRNDEGSYAFSELDPLPDVAEAKSFFNSFTDEIDSVCGAPYEYNNIQFDYDSYYTEYQYGDDCIIRLELYNYTEEGGNGLIAGEVHFSNNSYK